MRRHTVAGLALVAAVVAVAGPAEAARKSCAVEPCKVRRLGNPATRFNAPLKTPDDLRRMLRGKQADVKAVLDMAGWTGRIEDLDAAAAAAEIREISVEPGTSIPWMALRRHRKPGLVPDPAKDPGGSLAWAGNKPFAAYVLEFDSNGTHWVMTVPKPCGNFWITGTKIPEKVVPPATLGLRASDACVTQPINVTVTVGGAQPGDTVELTVDGKPAGSFAATNGSVDKSLPGLALGRHEVRASIARGGVNAAASASINPCPPSCSMTVTPSEIRRGKPLTLDASGSRVAPGVTATIQSVSVEVLRDGAAVETISLPAPSFSTTYVPKKSGSYDFRAVVTDSLGQKSEGPCAAGPVIVKAPPIVPFGAAFFGKERMVRPEFLGGRCAPLVGAKAGILAELGSSGAAELEAALGGKLNTRDSDNSDMFADLAVNRLLTNGFFGAGLSFWDITNSDTRSLAALVHGGVDLDRQGRFQFTVEGRVPFDQFDDIDNNYMFWGGIRIRPGRK